MSRREELEASLYAMLDTSSTLLQEGDVPGALEAAEQAHGLATEHRGTISTEALIDTLYVLADTLVEADSPDEALTIYEEIGKLAPGDEELPLHRGIALVHLVRFDEAQAALARCELIGETAGEKAWHLAVLAEFRGEEEAAERLFAEANRRAPDLYPLPARLDSQAVQRLLSDVIEDLPDEVRSALANVVIQIDPLPDLAMLRETEPPLSPFVLGLHVGTAWGDQSVFDQPQDLDRILIFQKNIERIAADPEGLHDQLRITLLHEIGHHLGWNEEDLRGRGLD